MHTHTLTTTSPLVHMNMHMKMCANTHPWKRQLQWQPHTQSCLTNKQKDKHIPRLSTIITHIPSLQGKHIPRLSTINTHKQFIYLLLLTFINMQLPSLKTKTSLHHAFHCSKPATANLEEYTWPQNIEEHALTHTQNIEEHTWEHIQTRHCKQAIASRCPSRCLMLLLLPM